MSFFIYTCLALVTLALPLYFYKHPPLTILAASLGEALCIAFVYGSTFVLCTEPNSCGAEWAKTATPALIATMNIGMIWPVLAGYAKQAAKEKDIKKDQLS